MAGFERRVAGCDLAGMGAALDVGLCAPRTFCAARLGGRAAIPLELRAGRDPGARGADAFHRAQRFAHTHRLSGRRISHLVGAPAGGVRLERPAERRLRTAAAAAQAAVASAPSRADYAGSRELLEPRIP